VNCSKRMVIAILAILLAAAGLSASSASATSLCKENKNPCGAPYPLKETVLAGLKEGTVVGYEAINSMGTKVLEGSCQESSMSWSTTENKGAGKVLLGTLTALLFGQCKNGKIPCERVKAENLAYGLEMFPTLVMGEGNGFLVNGTAPRKLKFEGCGVLAINCVYEGGSTLLGVEGGSPATIPLSFTMKAEGGNPACGTEVGVLGRYTTAAPKPLWVEREP
jgi:hypothetical protein